MYSTHHAYDLIVRCVQNEYDHQPIDHICYQNLSAHNVGIFESTDNVVLREAQGLFHLLFGNSELTIASWIM